MGGVQPTVIRDVFQSGSLGSVAFWVGDVGDDPLQGTVPGNFSAQGCAANHGETAEATGGGGLRISTAGSINGGFGLRGDRGLHTK